jgi:hypothetical protein
MIKRDLFLSLNLKSDQFLSDDKTQNDGAKVWGKCFEGIALLQVKPIDKL